MNKNLIPKTSVSSLLFFNKKHESFLSMKLNKYYISASNNRVGYALARILSL